MASFRVTRADLYPDGTTVTAYPASNWSQAALPPAGAPVGSSAGVAATMASGAGTITGLADATNYYAYGLVGGEHRYLRFRTSAAAPWRRVVERLGQIAAATGAGQRFFIGSKGGDAPTTAGGSAGVGVFYFDPADHAEEGKSTKVRLALVLLVNGAAPVSDFTVALFPVTAVAGAVGVLSITPGSVIAASSVTVVAPAISAMTIAASADFDPPAAGHYILGVNNSAVTAANSLAVCEVGIDVRNVKG